jgi:hypothetical protein
MASNEKNLFVFVSIYHDSCIMRKDLALSITTSLPSLSRRSISQKIKAHISGCAYLFSAAAREIANRRTEKERKNTNQKQIRTIHYRPREHCQHSLPTSSHFALSLRFFYVLYKTTTTFDPQTASARLLFIRILRKLKPRVAYYYFGSVDSEHNLMEFILKTIITNVSIYFPLTRHSCRNRVER